MDFENCARCGKRIKPTPDRTEYCQACSVDFHNTEYLDKGSKAIIREHTDRKKTTKEIDTYYEDGVDCEELKEDEQNEDWGLINS